MLFSTEVVFFHPVGQPAN